MSVKEKAIALHGEGCNCAQSVLCSLEEYTHLPLETAKRVAEGFGGKGYRAETLEELQAAMEKALKADGPVWIDCRIDREERVLPMIPAGKTVDDMIVE